MVPVKQHLYILLYIYILEGSELCVYVQLRLLIVIVVVSIILEGSELCVYVQLRLLIVIVVVSIIRIVQQFNFIWSLLFDPIIRLEIVVYHTTVVPTWDVVPIVPSTILLVEDNPNRFLLLLLLLLLLLILVVVVVGYPDDPHYHCSYDYYCYWYWYCYWYSYW